MGTKRNPAPNDCYAKADMDEPMFTFLARDSDAPAFIRAWAQKRFKAQTINAEKAEEAFECARAMEEWRKKNRP